jgi:F0F1-type ATP synthase membrane subunit b/b'
MYPGFILAGVAFAVLAGMIWFARKAGSDAVEKAIGERNNKAAERISDAQSRAPTSRDNLVKRLRDGGGL